MASKGRGGDEGEGKEEVEGGWIRVCTCGESSGQMRRVKALWPERESSL